MTKEIKYTFQSYLEHLNRLTPESGFPLWKAVELGKFVRSQMKEDIKGWLDYPEDWKNIN